LRPGIIDTRTRRLRNTGIGVPVWAGADYLVPTGIQSSDRPNLNESLYRLRYPAPLLSLQDTLHKRKDQIISVVNINLVATSLESGLTCLRDGTFMF
jgi:hypothetical protein